MEIQLAKKLDRHLREVIIPYWQKLIDYENGGFFGYVDEQLKIDRRADKGVILNSRILWFFASAYQHTKDQSLLAGLEQSYRFLMDKCLDREYGGVYWMMGCDGKVTDPMKHTYNQAFAIYALTACYEAVKRPEALDTAMTIFELIESRCTDRYGYCEAFDRTWRPVANEALSENGLLADKTMNTLLHVLEAYTELYRITGSAVVGDRLTAILELFHEKVYNPGGEFLEVFFNAEMGSIADLYSYGHDIEASWLLDRAADVLGDQQLIAATREWTGTLAKQVYQRACRQQSVANECFGGVVDETRVWWVQAEAVVGFYNAYQNTGMQQYRDAAEAVWNFTERNLVDPRAGSEWFWETAPDGRRKTGKPLTAPWKCPYHNGRMCIEIYRRIKDV